MTGQRRCSYPFKWRGLLLGLSGIMVLVPPLICALPPTTTHLSDMGGENDLMGGERADLMGEKADLIGGKSDLMGGKTNLMGDKADLMGGKADLMGGKADLMGGKVDLMGGGEEAGDLDVDPETWNDYLNTLFDPVFDPSVVSNVSAVVGQTVHLVCRVNNLGTKTVSWIRHADTHILTVGSFTYTSDHRFSALHREGTNEWTLQIKNPTLRDSGLYECQVSTKPIRAYLIYLSVVVPQARILHAPELHTEEGSGLNLTCVVAPSPAPPEYIFWYHGKEVLNYESDASMEVSVRQEGHRTISTLLVIKATLAHSGRYQCAPSNTNRADIMVHVFKAEEPAAMHTNSSNSLPPSSLLLLLHLQLLFSAVLCLLLPAVLL